MSPKLYMCATDRSFVCLNGGRMMRQTKSRRAPTKPEMKAKTNTRITHRTPYTYHPQPILGLHYTYLNYISVFLEGNLLSMYNI